MHKFDKSQPGPTFKLYILSFLRSAPLAPIGFVQHAVCVLLSVGVSLNVKDGSWRLRLVMHLYLSRYLYLYLSHLFVFVYKYIRVCIYVQLCGVSHCQGWWEGGVRGVRGSVVTILMAAILSSHTVSYTGQPAIYGAIYINTWSCVESRVLFALYSRLTNSSVKRPFGFHGRSARKPLLQIFPQIFLP